MEAEAIEAVVVDIMAAAAAITGMENMEAITGRGILITDMADMVGTAITGMVLTIMEDGGGVQPVYF